MSSRSSRKRRFRFEDFPVELILEILSHLRVASIKQLSLTSSKFRLICLPVIFEDLSFYSYKTPRNFLTAMRRCEPFPVSESYPLMMSTPRIYRLRYCNGAP